MTIRTLLLTTVLLAAQIVSGQETKPSSRPAFEVASVRRNTSGPGGVFMRRLSGVGFEAGNVTPRDLILFAYDIQRSYVIGAPDWIGNERFDIVARAGASPQTTTPGSNVEMLMLRALIEDRFRLATHTETREMSVCTLVLARSDGRLGPQLRRSQIDCLTRPANPGGEPPADATPRPECSGRNGPGYTSASGRPISSFLFFLAGNVQRPVIDRTGLTGTWGFELTFNPDGVAGAPASPDDPRPSIFTALQEQLGLRLEPSTAPVPVLVIDRIDRPTEN